jgi:hypothetical protein
MPEFDESIESVIVPLGNPVDWIAYWRLYVMASRLA